MRLIHSNQNKKEMKKLVLAMALVLSVSLPMTVQAQRHRHNPKIESTQNKPDTVEVTAFSDTTSCDTAVDDSDTYDAAASSQDDDKVSITDIHDPFAFMIYLTTLGAGGILVAIFSLLFVIVLCGAPFVFLALIVYWLMHRKKVEYRIVEKAVENGQPIPDNVLSNSVLDKEIIWQQGIKKVALGVGLIIFGLILGSFFTAIGAIVVCWGAGQCVIARTSAQGNKRDNVDDTYDDIVQNKDSDTQA